MSARLPFIILRGSDLSFTLNCVCVLAMESDNPRASMLRRGEKKSPLVAAASRASRIMPKTDTYALLYTVSLNRDAIMQKSQNERA